MQAARRLVVAFFEHPSAADAAARFLQRRPRAVGTGGSVGMLSCDSRGQLTARLGPHGRADGCGVGAVLDHLVHALTGRDPPVTGALFGAGSDLSADDLARFAAELEAGQALVAVLARRYGADRAVLTLTGCGGRAELHWITGEALQPGTGRSYPLDRSRPSGRPPQAGPEGPPALVRRGADP